MSNPVTARPSRLKRWVAWHPLLFAAYPVLFLWSQNLGETAARDALLIVAIAVGVAALVVALLALPLGDARRAALVVSPIVLGLLMFGHVGNIVGHGTLRSAAQAAGWLAVVVVGVIAAIRLREAALARIDRALTLVAGVLVVVTLVLIVPAQLRVLTASETAMAESTDLARSSDRPLRDVYYVVLDRYGSDRSMALRYKIENDLTAWLGERGFRVLPDSHANYVRTVLSLASTLNMTHLAGLASRVGADNPDRGPLFAMLQDSLVVRQFKALGYRYLHIGSMWEPGRTDRAADRDLYVGGPSDFAAALFDNSALPSLLRRLGVAGQSWNERAYADKVFGFDALAGVRDEPGPKFVFAHILVPHPPYVVARDGSFVGPDKVPTKGRNPRDQLAWANGRLRAWIEDLQSLPEDQRPIVILQADEGPYPWAYSLNTADFDWSAATPEEIETKFGILNAWYLPDGTDPGLDDAMTSVNTFPVLFSGYFGLPVERLEGRSYTSPVNRPYDFTDVTERLGGSSE